jgi:hypothetical protein
VNAADSAGNIGSLTVTVSIDIGSPVVNLQTPASGSTVSGPTVQLEGRATDSLSGVAAAQCNHTAAQIQGDAVNCTIDVEPGLNTVILTVTDVAGNVASAGVRVRRTAPAVRIAVVPSQMTLRLGPVRDVGPERDSVIPRCGPDWDASIGCDVGNQ